MKRAAVSRRFEVQARTHDALKAVAQRLRDASSGAVLTLAPADLDDLPVMRVRVSGPADAVAKVRRSVREDPDQDPSTVIVRRDWLELLPDYSRPDDYPDQRALLRIDPEARSRDVLGKGERVVVAIVDSGIADRHPAFDGHLWSKTIDGREVHGARFMGEPQDYDVTDQEGHGTRLAGTILATANRAKGIELMAVKFFDAAVQPVAANAAAAINFALEHEASIINLSFDLGIGSPDLRAAFRKIAETKTLVVVAAGNTGSNNDEYPSVPSSYAAECPDNVITVMATDWYDQRPTFSNFGAKTVDLAAPGVGIASPRPMIARDQSPYGRYTGTSAAAAHVTGAAALLKSQDSTRSVGDLKTCLMESGDVLVGLKCRSRRRLNLGKALEWKP